ncbi:MAG: SPOR domain-containing protein, partial [Paracoccaceae bacterium]
STVWIELRNENNEPICGLNPDGSLNEDPADTMAAGAGVTPATPAPEEEVAVEATAAAPTAPARKERSRAKATPLHFVGQELTPAADSLCLKTTGQGERLYLSDGRRLTRCSPVADDKLAFLNGLGAPGVAVAGADLSESALAAAKKKGKDGYRVIWANGPLRDVAAPAPAATSPATKPASGQYIQLGAFAEPANRDAAIARVKQLGLPAARQKLQGGALTAVLAGPFESAGALTAALVSLRQDGFTDAYVR